MPFTSGTYRGQTSDGGHQIDLRVDVGRSNMPTIPGRPAVISGDVFSLNPMTFLYSFMTLDGAIAGGTASAQLQIEEALPKVGKWTGTLAATLLAGSGGTESIQVSVQTGTAAPIVVKAAKVSDYLRAATLEVDIVQRPAGSNQTAVRAPGTTPYRTVTMSVLQAMQWAGVELTESSPRELIPAADVPLEWNEQSLANVMLAHSQTRLDGAAWRLYLLCATRFRPNADGSTTRGILIQAGASSLPGAGSPRQGAAIFFDGCAASSSQQDFERDYIRTAVHELGHVFDLPHTFDPLKGNARTYASTSFMNYPERYSGGGDYWDAFKWQFDPDELGTLRHGTLDRVIMGGSPFYGSLVAEVAHRWRGAGRPANGLRLKLRVSPKEHTALFDFGEPIAVEAKLTNTSRSTVTVDDVLSPVHHRTEYIIERPSGVCFRHLPILRRCDDSRAVKLRPKSARGHRSSIYEVVQLGYDARGFRMMEPGRYRIQAVYHSPNGPIFSNVLTVHSKVPRSDEEQEIALLFDDELALYLGLWGAPPFAGAADKACEKWLDRADRVPHPLVAEYARCRFNLETAGHHHIDRTRGRRKLRFIRNSPNRDVVATLRRAMHLTEESLQQQAEGGRGRLPASKPIFTNIIYGHCAKQLFAHFAATDELSTREHKALEDLAVQQLERRGVHRHFTNPIRRRTGG
jgi:hypothetical protein